MKFIDEVVLEVRAGDGGAGCVSFYRGKGIPRGGPDGGDGGNGGSVYLQADDSLNTLLDLRYTPHVIAAHGQPGMGSQCNGRYGDDVCVRVPVGTIVWDFETGEQLADLTQHDEKIKIAQGGRGGLGNMNFATPVRRAPMFAQPGTAGEHRRLRLELRLLADVGFCGFPNVGKSTLISKISAANPKIADYPFTTLVPNLGVVRVDEGFSFVVADIPGLIPGASRGAGLGSQFLRHISRVQLLVHVIGFDFSETRDLVSDYEVIRHELEQYHQSLAEKPELVVLNKIDLQETRDQQERLRRFLQTKGRDLVCVSAATGEGISDFIVAMTRMLQTHQYQSSLHAGAAQS